MERQFDSCMDVEKAFFIESAKVYYHQSAKEALES